MVNDLWWVRFYESCGVFKGGGLCESYVVFGRVMWVCCVWGVGVSWWLIGCLGCKWFGVGYIFVLLDLGFVFGEWRIVLVYKIRYIIDKLYIDI